MCGKNDLLRNGDEAVIARTKNATYPGKVYVDGWYQSTGFPTAFSWNNSKLGEKLRMTGGLSYTRVQELIQIKLQQLGLFPQFIWYT